VGGTFDGIAVVGALGVLFYMRRMAEKVTYAEIN